MKALLAIPTILLTLALGATGTFGATLAAGGGTASPDTGTPGPHSRAHAALDTRPLGLRGRAYDRQAYGGASPRVAASIQTRGYTPQTTNPASVLVAVPQARSFSWPDAGVGAGTALGVIALLAGSTLVVLRRRQHEAI
jgi:hypothetical protein